MSMQYSTKIDEHSKGQEETVKLKEDTHIVILRYWSWVKMVFVHERMRESGLFAAEETTLIVSLSTRTWGWKSREEKSGTDTAPLSQVKWLL